MRLAFGIVLATLSSAPAYAGGLGVLGIGGAHTERVFYYSNQSRNGATLTNVDDFRQFELNQTLLNLGGGLELVLGDRDDRILGSVRAYYQADFAQQDPAEITTEVAPDAVVAAFREEPRHLGFMMVGLSWGFLGNPNGLQFGAIGHVGGAVVTEDGSEFLAAQIGPMVTYKTSRQVQLFGDLQVQARVTRDVRPAAHLTIGARYLFD